MSSEFNPNIFKIPLKNSSEEIAALIEDPSDLEYKSVIFSEDNEVMNSKHNNYPVPIKPQKRVSNKSSVDGQPLLKRHKSEDWIDATFPKELREQFEPLFCKLCAVQSNATLMAQRHYESKKHAKKVRAFLVEHAQRTGELLHPIAASATSKTDQEFNPKHFYCDVCDLKLTGKAHADSHYMGRNHQRVIMGNKPAGHGFFDPNGKFLRTDGKKPEGRDNFGLDFIGSSTDESKQTTSSPFLRCELCNVCATSEQQLTMHLNGKSHQKKMKRVVN